MAGRYRSSAGACRAQSPGECEDHDRDRGDLGQKRIDVEQDARGPSADVGDEQDDQGRDDPSHAQADDRRWLSRVLVLTSRRVFRAALDSVLDW
jgi:hypothetical protein